MILPAAQTVCNNCRVHLLIGPAGARATLDWALVALAPPLGLAAMSAQLRTSVCVS